MVQDFGVDCAFLFTLFNCFLKYNSISGGFISGHFGKTKSIAKCYVIEEDSIITLNSIYILFHDF